MTTHSTNEIQTKLRKLKEEATSDKAKQLLNRSINTIILSVNSLRKSCLHPYVQAKVKTCFKPILIVAVGIYAAGLVLVVPITVIAFLVHILSLGYLETQHVSATARSLLYEATTFIPLVSVALLRQFVRKPLDKCFIHMLREVNPSMAQRLESGTALKGTGSQRRSSSRMYTRYVNQIAGLLALEVGIFLCKRIPYIGVFAHPVAHFLTVSRTLDSRPAAAVAVLGLVPVAGPLISGSMRLWRGSHVLGGEMVGEYVSKVIPHADRDAFWRRNGLTIALFMLPSLMLMKVPVLGAAAVFPMAASAAWLVNLLEGNMTPDASTAVDRQQGARHVPLGEDEFFGHGGSLRQRGAASGQPSGAQSAGAGQYGPGMARYPGHDGDVAGQGGPTYGSGGPGMGAQNDSYSRGGQAPMPSAPPLGSQQDYRTAHI